MSFISDEFVLFFVVVAAAYFLIPHRFRWILLLASSYFFYGYYRFDYLLLFIFITVTNYVFALLIDDTPREKAGRRRVFFIACIGISLTILFVFKYFDFIAGSLNFVFQQVQLGQPIPMLSLILPIGISFHTFQAMGHTIDVYTGRIAAERHLGIFATFNSFFPQLVAGPIERATHLLPQFREVHTFDYERAVSGLRLILWGAFKKIVIADRLAAYVNTVYNAAHDYSGLYLIIATVFFGIQIYCDFSGYSDIAIGTARIMGFRLMVNFRQPYLSQSIREFWRRWHISLSTWFRDYVYFPLGGNRVPLLRNLFNLFVVFLVSGLWHGASWTFVIWGALHGLFIIVEELLDRVVGRAKNQPPNRWQKYFGTAVTFALVMFAWIFFRANSLDDAFHIVSNIFNFSGDIGDIARPFASIAPLDQVHVEFWMALILIMILFVVDWLDATNRLPQLAVRSRPLVRWAVYYAAVLLIVYSVSTSQATFIYFQF